MTNVRADDIYPAKKGELRTFWQERLSRRRLYFTPERNLKQTLWQTPFAVEANTFMMGGQKFSDSDTRFPADAGQCLAIAGNGFFEQSVVRFCRATKAPDSVQVVMNGSVVSAQGQVGLSADAAVELAVRWPSGAELQMTLKEPKEPNIELIRVMPDEWDLVHATDPEYVRVPAQTGEFSYPLRPILQSQRIKHVPFKQTLNGPLGVEFVRVATGLPEKVPSQAELPTLGSEYGLSGSSSEVRTALVTKPGHKQVLIFKNVELGNQDFEFEWRGRFYQTSVTRIPRVEFSLRGSGLLSSENDFILSGEAALLFHPGHIWSKRLETVDAHRLSFRARAFGAITTFKGFQPTYTIPLTFMSGEGRLLLKRGAWNLDEVYGALFSYNQFKLYTDQTTYSGLGFFWGRPMPRGFSLSKYPQYVDMDLTYLQPLIAARGIGSGWAANFHGKVLFPSNWFVEGGVGAMNVGAGASSLQVLIGTLGGGVMF